MIGDEITDDDLQNAIRVVETALGERRAPEEIELRELGKALLSHLDALMPAIEKAVRAEWDRGNYINGPQFVATVEAFRAALTKNRSHDQP